MSSQLDHRQLADEMEIFFFDEQIGAGLPVWLPNGVAVRDALESYIKQLEARHGYQRVVSPHIAKAELYANSGHLRSFIDGMYPPMKWLDNESHYYLKPMNCPHHHKVFASRLRSYRELPLRVAEYGQVYRFEPSGSLRGLARVRGLCQNDAHIYVDPAHALKEILSVIDLHEQCYRALGLKGYRYRLSLRDPQRPDKYDGNDGEWLRAESLLREALIKYGLEFFEAKGEAVFYAPKIDVQMQLGSGEESIASIQLDFNSAAKFHLEYIDSGGERRSPWIIHRAPLGSHERFIAMLLEYYQGQFPKWLAPIQLLLIPLGEQHQLAAHSVAEKLIGCGLRAVVDQHSGSLSKRLLYAHRLRPYAIAVIGDKELQSQSLKLQARGQQLEASFDKIAEVFEA